MSRVRSANHTAKTGLDDKELSGGKGDNILINNRYPTGSTSALTASPVHSSPQSSERQTDSVELDSLGFVGHTHYCYKLFL